jgi:hypothetical protein
VAGSWADFYQSDLQSVYAAWVAPTLFLLYWLLSRPARRPGVEPRAAAFMNVYAPLFAIETLVDPVATGPLLRWLAFDDRTATDFTVPFVLFGDFRVYLLIFYVLAPDYGIRGALWRAARWTLLVPIVAFGVTSWLAAERGPLPSQAIWIVYEIAFFAVMVFFELRLVPNAVGFRRFEVRQYLGALVRYVALYYALWAIADLLIVLRGWDFGWALRVIPNQLYYGLWIPFAYLSFYSPRYAPTRSAVHASR